jgi:GNAT superfamily N-acetyltransferase
MKNWEEQRHEELDHAVLVARKNNNMKKPACLTQKSVKSRIVCEETARVPARATTFLEHNHTWQQSLPSLDNALGGAVVASSWCTLEEPAAWKSCRGGVRSRRARIRTTKIFFAVHPRYKGQGIRTKIFLVLCTHAPRDKNKDFFDENVMCAIRPLRPCFAFHFFRPSHLLRLLIWCRSC